ncbi:MAG: diaminopimelate epimerase [Candidatus Tectomicrobia bacterium]|uniref:Diaminopimelate epimerase n=1 Tax=Tectimicrobiota bacterium TaxID=2528274 RepID=A0A937W4N4_UNCTE|nr:diaminopimelate epimerase [Candidatus Tectomicrobia bacterium]
MKFTKMHGLGNDYIYVNGFEEHLDDPGAVARAVSDRHFGIGSDGLILILPSTQADFRMRMFNADGSEAQMCGNGIRCLAKYVYDHGMTQQTTLQVETLAGTLTLQLFPKAGVIEQVRVNMGEPRLERTQIPMRGAAGRVIREPLLVDGTAFDITAVSMGNPHCVVFVDDPQTFDVALWGPRFEHHPAFPEGVNTEFVRVLDPHTFSMRVWERGSGETLACGTGASAVAVACHLTDRTARRVTGHLLGGSLELEWNETDNHVYMTGPATEVFHGEWPC